MCWMSQSAMSGQSNLRRNNDPWMFEWGSQSSVYKSRLPARVLLLSSRNHQHTWKRTFLAKVEHPSTANAQRAHLSTELAMPSLFHSFTNAFAQGQGRRSSSSDSLDESTFFGRSGYMPPRDPDVASRRGPESGPRVRRAYSGRDGRFGVDEDSSDDGRREQESRRPSVGRRHHSRDRYADSDRYGRDDGYGGERFPRADDFDDRESRRQPSARQPSRREYDRAGRGYAAEGRSPDTDSENDSAYRSLPRRPDLPRQERFTGGHTYEQTRSRRHEPSGSHYRSDSEDAGGRSHNERQSRYWERESFRRGDPIESDSDDGSDHHSRRQGPDGYRTEEWNPFSESFRRRFAPSPSPPPRSRYSGARSPSPPPSSSRYGRARSPSPRPSGFRYGRARSPSPLGLGT